MATNELPGSNSFENTKAKDSKGRTVNVLIRAWKPCFSADGKYAFAGLNAIWSRIHEARIAFLFERTPGGWKLILRRDTRQV